MVLSIKEAEELNNGKLSKRTFLKVMYTIDFEKYLYKYCKIVNDFRNEYLGDFYRITNFNIFNYHVIVYMKNGECEKIEYTKIN